MILGKLTKAVVVICFMALILYGFLKATGQI